MRHGSALSHSGESTDSVDVASLPGIKEDELRRLGNCVICRKPMLPGGPTFYCVSIRRGIFDAAAVRRRVGLTMMLGSDPLARVFSPNDDLAKVFDGPHDVIVHEECAGEIGHLLRLVEG